MTAVSFEDGKASKKVKSKDDYDKRKAQKSELLQELRREALDEPEEIHMGVGRRTKTAKYEEAVEEFEKDNFKRVSMTKKEK